MADSALRSPGLRVSVVDAKGGSVRAPGLAGWLARVAPRTAAGDVTVALVSDVRVRRLNRIYRGKDTPTDVLSFPTRRPTRRRRPGRSSRVQSPESRVHSPKSRAQSPESAFLGDIVIARGVARRQARRAGHAEATEWRVLALHGLLHLLGYDHETDNGRMARVEARLRRTGGLTGGLIERGRAR